MGYKMLEKELGEKCKRCGKPMGHMTSHHVKCSGSVPSAQQLIDRTTKRRK